MPIVLGSNPSAVIRLHGWERAAFVAFLLATVVLGALAAATLIGASLPRAVTTAAETLAAIAAVAAFVAFCFAVRRYDGESVDLPPTRLARLLARLRNGRD